MLRSALVRRRRPAPMDRRRLRAGRINDGL